MALIPMHLRLEQANGSIGQEYRIYDGQLEVRQLEPSMDADDEDRTWRRVTPEELTTHVRRDSVVAEWLKQRWGWRRLLRACLQEQDLYLFDNTASAAERSAA